MIPDDKLHWEEVFRTGEHTDMNGNIVEYTQEDLGLIVSRYNEQEEKERHVAPIILGHEEGTDTPAYGWVERLKVVGEKVLAGIRDIKSEFAQWVEDGHYRFKSIGIENGLLKHLAFLGATPPAIKGLNESTITTDNKFSGNRNFYTEIVIEKNEQLTETETKEQYKHKSLNDIYYSLFGEKPMRFLTEENFMQFYTAMKDFLAGLLQEEQVATIVAEIDGMIGKPEFWQEQEQAEAETADIEASETETVLPENPENEIIKNLQSRIEGLEKEKRLADTMAFCEFAIKENKMIPAQKQHVIHLFELLHNKQLQFSEGKTKSGVELFKEFVKMQEKANLVNANYSEGIAKPVKQSNDGLMYAEPVGFEKELIDAAESIKAKHPEMSYIDALAHARKNV